MNKLDVVLVVLNKNLFERAVLSLNFKNVNLIAIIVENAPIKPLKIGNREIPQIPFFQIQTLLDESKNFIWLINGFQDGVNDIWKMKKFLMNNSVPEDNIVNFEILSHITVEWLANLRYIEKHGADCFATGIGYTEVGLDLKCIPFDSCVNLAGSNQDLRQGYLTAKYVFEHVAPGTIKLVIIGLAPYSFRYTNADAFSVCSRNFQYMVALGNSDKKTLHDLLLEILVSDEIKNIFTQTTEQKADLNFDRLKKVVDTELPARAVINWEAELDNLTKKYRPQVIQSNFQILKDYIELCLANGAKPVGVVFPFSLAMKKNYNKELLYDFREKIRQLEESYDFKCVDMFGMNLSYNCFYNMSHLNLGGSLLVSLFLSAQLYEKNILPIKNFCVINYNYFSMLSSLLHKNDYNKIMSEIFAKSVEMIRCKKKIKIGFVSYDSSMWCGDELYNFFEKDPRFEPTIFLCLRSDHGEEELIKKDFWHGVEQFKSHGLNVVAVEDINFALESQQDVIIFLTPYFEVLPFSFRDENLTARTLLVYIPYAYETTWFHTARYVMSRVVWKLFFPSIINKEIYDKNCPVGMPRGIYSGLPKTDVFYKNPVELKFNWKLARPDAKKIIYAPHWSINEGIKHSTFQWNYLFMYEFAKAHPEISWVFKPHPNLLFSAVKEGLFPSTEAFKEYLQLWNDLPNAQVYTGAYYNGLFATSDGMIMDCGSFIAEYQYTHKPLIFLTRDTQVFNELGKEIMKVLYSVDGKDLDGIGLLIQKIFIESEDPLFELRQKFFDEQLNYFKYNGMTASEFIYKSIAEELKAVSI